MAGAYRLVVSNTLNCSDTSMVNIIVNPRPALGNDTTLAICQGNTQNLNNVYNLAGLITNWTINGNTIDTIANYEDTIFHLEHTNGANFAMINMVNEKSFFETKNKK